MKIEQQRELALKLLTGPISSYVLHEFNEVKEQEDVDDLFSFLDQYFTDQTTKYLHYDNKTANLEVRSTLLSSVMKFILSLNEYEFEKYSALICSILGFKEFYATKKSGDEGIDFIAFTDVEDYRIDYQKYAIGQSKKHKSILVNVAEVRELAGSILLFKNKEFSTSKKIYDKFDVRSFTPTFVYFMTSYFFSPRAEYLCKQSHILPLDIIDLSLISLSGIEEGKKRWLKTKTKLDINAIKRDLEKVNIDTEN